MTGRTLLFMLLSVPAVAGCGSLQRPPKAGFPELRSHAREADGHGRGAKVTRTAESRDNDRHVAQTAGAADGGTGWWATLRRQVSGVAKEIQADLDFHDTEGLQQFAPDALAAARL